MKTKLVAHSRAETEDIGHTLAESLGVGDFVALYGDLGAGKTSFVRGMARRICPNAKVKSPTYTIVNEYSGSVPLFHFDMYRIDGEETLYATGFFDYLDRGVVAAEWCENIARYVPERSVFVKIERDASCENEDIRIITIEDKR